MRRFVGLCAALALAVALVGPWPLSRDDPLATDAGREARALAARTGADAARAAEAAAGRTLRAGFARVEVAAPVGKERGANLAGYGVRAGIFPAPAEAVHDPCFARAIALVQEGDRGAAALILGADLLYVNARLRGLVLAELRRDPGPAALPPDRIIFTATHSHSAPGNFSEGPAETIACGRFREEVIGATAAALAEAARAALRDLRPAEVAIAVGPVPALVRNRYWRRGERVVPLDADLWTVWFRRPGAERPAAVLAVYGAHATVVGPERPALISGDWPGAFSRALEGGPPAAGAPPAGAGEDAFVEAALLAAGSVGSQAPRPPNDAEEWGPADYARSEAMGEAMAREARALAVRGLRFDAAPGVAARTVEVPMPPLAFRLAPRWRASPVLMSWAYPAGREPSPFSVLRIGRDFALVAFPAEISGEVALEMKRRAAAQGVRLAVTSFAGAYHGYVPPDAYYGRWRYENHLSIHGPRFAEFLATLGEAAAAGR